ncbi:hypothetical protein JOD20_005259 [Herpetosiphon giganteus]|nr:hypothetical protein [Herpetosiphon giganteus]
MVFLWADPTHRPLCCPHPAQRQPIRVLRRRVG